MNKNVLEELWKFDAKIANQIHIALQREDIHSILDTKTYTSTSYRNLSNDYICNTQIIITTGIFVA
jgi:hypothetical protein